MHILRKCAFAKRGLKTRSSNLVWKISIQGTAHPAGLQGEGKQGLSVQSEPADVENLGKPLVYKVQTLELELRRKLNASV